MAKSSATKRPKLVLASEATLYVCRLLAEELLRWPDVKARSMFGMRAFYRGAAVFAMLPDKRALERPEAIAYKLPDSDQREEGESWQLFELKGEDDVENALARLDKAYTRAAGGGRKGLNSDDTASQLRRGG
jgi:hypothetical protein